MHVFPDQALLDALLGDEVGQIQLNPYGLGFAFSSGKHLSAEWRVVHVEPDGTSWSIDCQALGASPLVLNRLLYKPIVAVEREDLQLTLRLEDGSALFILSELGPYESGVLTLPDGGFVAF